jgi:CheY-like chemotaxis protein
MVLAFAREGAYASPHGYRDAYGFADTSPRDTGAGPRNSGAPTFPNRLTCPMSQQKVLFIDDDFLASQRPRETLEQRYEVIICYDAASSVCRIKEDATISAVIADVRMDSPAGEEAATQGGEFTGIWIASQVRDTLIARNTPIIFWSNHSPSAVEREARKIGLPDHLQTVLGRLATPAAALPSLVEAAIQRASAAS